MTLRPLSLAVALALPLFVAPAAQAAKTLVYCSEGSPEGFNAQFYTAGTTFDAASQPIYNRLVEFERGATTIIPGLAESWDISTDGLTYTFHLRKGVKFHTTAEFKPTRDFNADDVLFSFLRQLDPNHPFHKVSGGSYEYFEGMGMPEVIDKVEKLDDYTVRFTLKRAEAPFLADIAMDFASIMSAEYADKMMKAGTPEVIDFKPVGTGPFQLVNYQKDAVIRYKANPDYWRGRAKIDNLVFAITPDASVRYAKLDAGECQVMAYPNPADLDKMAKDPKINLLHQPGLNIGYLSFNVEKKPFDDVRVRQALNLAVNKAAIIEAIYQGAGTVAKNPIPPTIWSYNDAVKDYPYDPEQAKKLLAEAGYPNGFDTDLWAMPVQRPYNPNARRMAEMIQADWAKVGVKAKIVSYEWGEYLKRLKAGDHQTALMGWTGDNGDPDNFLATLLSCDAAKNGSNYSKWCYAPYEELITKARSVSDLAERTRLYEQAQVVFKEQAPWITIAHSVVYQPVRKEVEDFRIHPFGLNLFYGVDLKK
ncbi:ABC transporter substrate-binding protein [Plasticicumulans acidivorans]|uniref:Dipeptide transport system substrate-binding protein n=1 Tax=Plasticicumulans acidivorans TaxID=886464 RepID=A0A317MUF8_9GAMM|nr:ABC transporter substrate-binding protein [Plasticicumulans acidivorans]PWV61066.1 dipeptide transport system substrate-binding protein [Plasticicumulans acidivorans]